jgi:PIN domain nuclease of toxin-antitoxin system
LSQNAIREIKSSENDVAVSVVTFWKISLKYGLWKLEMSDVTPEELPDFARQMNLTILGIAPDEPYSFHNLPSFHTKTLSTESLSGRLFSEK